MAVLVARPSVSKGSKYRAGFMIPKTAVRAGTPKCTQPLYTKVVPSPSKTTQYFKVLPDASSPHPVLFTGAGLQPKENFNTTTARQL